MPAVKKKAPKKPSNPKSRQRKAPRYKHFRLSKKIKQNKNLPGMMSLFKKSCSVIWQEKYLFGGIVLITGAISLMLVQGYGASVNFSDLKQSTTDLLGGGVSTTSTNFALFGQLLNAASPQANEVSGAYRTVLSIVVSLAIIWALRQVLAGEKVRLRDAFYRGMYPLVPFILVLFIIGIQLLPFVFGNLISTTVFGNGLAITAVEQFIWGLIVGSLYLFSVYMVLSSVFALYIATLPDMTPLKALRSARGLVLHRRLAIAARLLFLMIMMSILACVILLPLIYLLPSAVEAAFYLFSALALVITHSYMYNLYRSLL